MEIINSQLLMVRLDLGIKKEPLLLYSPPPAAAPAAAPPVLELLHHPCSMAKI